MDNLRKNYKNSWKILNIITKLLTRNTRKIQK